MGTEFDVLRSAEVRWFFPHADDAAWSHAHRDLQQAKAEGMRADSYLCFPTARFAGVKLREYQADEKHPTRVNLEFKLLEKDCGLMTFSNGAAGRIELWKKWSATVNTTIQEYKSLVTGPGGAWREVIKFRRLRKFAFANGKIEPVSERVGQGCNVELTTIGQNGAEGCTLGFEAFSDSLTEDSLVILKETVNRIFSVDEVPRLPAALSRSYPQWLLERSGGAITTRAG